MPSWRLRFAALVMLVLVAVGCGGGDVADDGAVASGEAAICSGGRDVFLAVKQGQPATLYADATRARADASRLAPGTRVVRRQTRELSPGAPFSLVDVQGPAGQRSGWVDATQLEMVSLRSGDCASGVNPEALPHAFERVQSQPQALPASALKSAVACAAGFADGVTSEGSGFVSGLEHMVFGAAGLVQEVVRRDGLVVLYAMGSGQAAAKLADAGASDRLKVQAAVATLGHAVPAVHAYLASQWVFYEALPPEAKAGYVCKVLGRVSFEVVAFLATSEISLTRSETMLKSLDDANLATAQLAELPGRVGASPAIEIGHDFLATQEGAYWERLQGDLDALAQTSDASTQQALLREISDDQNVAYKGYVADVGEWRQALGRGNCGNAAFTTMVSLATGNVVCTLPYLTHEPSFALPSAFIDALDKVGAAPVAGTITGSADALEAELMGKLADRQMAFLVQGGPAGGHASFVVKLDGQLWHVNNQGGEAALGVAAGKLQTLREWTVSFGAQNRGQAQYMPVITGLKLRGL